jgi:hypothetical protein
MAAPERLRRREQRELLPVPSPKRRGTAQSGQESQTIRTFRTYGFASIYLSLPGGPTLGPKAQGSRVSRDEQSLSGVAVRA